MGIHGNIDIDRAAKSAVEIYLKLKYLALVVTLIS